jgi:hypothetical protein
MGWIAVRTRLLITGRGTSGPVDVAGREAMVNVCGVVMAIPQGHSWPPHPSTGWQ